MELFLEEAMDLSREKLRDDDENNSTYVTSQAPLVPKFAGSNPAEAVGFFRTKKFSARLPSEGK